MQRPIFALFILCLIGATPAHASVVTNLSDAPQTIEVQTARGYAPMTLAPNQTWRDEAREETIRYHGREIQLEYDQEYAIWQGGDFGPQKRNRALDGGRPL